MPWFSHEAARRVSRANAEPSSTGPLQKHGPRRIDASCMPDGIAYDKHSRLRPWLVLTLRRIGRIRLICYWRNP